MGVFSRKAAPVGASAAACAFPLPVNFEGQFGTLFTDTFNLGEGRNFIGALATDRHLIAQVLFAANGTTRPRASAGSGASRMSEKGPASFRNRSSGP
jgi:hypothetical protein